MPRRSDNIVKGPERMPNRSLLRACGYTDEELSRPMIGVVSAYSEIIPGHINLDKIADAVKAAAWRAARRCSFPQLACATALRWAISA